MKTILDKLKDYYKNNTEEKIAEDWKKSEKYDKVNSPTVDEFLKANGKQTTN